MPINKAVKKKKKLVNEVYPWYIFFYFLDFIYKTFFGQKGSIIKTL